MATSKARSPSYPAIGLKEAIEKADAVYRNDYQNQVPRAVAAKHMGYASLNGKSLGVLSALLKFGLLEGRGDSTRVSDLALKILAHAPGEPDRADAIREASSRPELFAELDKRYPDGRGSDAAIRSYLLTQKFIPQAADSALRSYRETKTLVETERVAYDSVQPEEPNDMQLHAQPSPAPVIPTALEAIAQRVADRPLNKINMNIEGDVVHLVATLDYRGLRMMEKKIANLKALMAPDDTDEVPLEDDLAN